MRCAVAQAAGLSTAPTPGVPGSDLVLSSGFMAFASHSGFLQGVQDAGLEVQGVCGTSSGALAGSLYCAGYSPAQVGRELGPACTQGRLR